MKKLKLFDFGVFKEGFRHLKLPGILFLVLNSLPTIIDFIDQLPHKSTIQATSNAVINSSASSLVGTSDLLYTSISYSFFGLLFLLIYVLPAPVLILSAFKFLTKRNASDIYHSLPFKRETIFISLFSSVAAWLGIIIFGSSLLALFSSLLLGYTPIFSNWLMNTISIFIAMLFIAACFSLATTITGTLGSNITVGLLIAFLPRLVITSIIDAIVNSLPILTSEHLSFLLNNQYNLVTSFTGYFSVIFANYRNQISTNIYACIYTLVVAFLYTALACFLFRRRKSESAAQSAPNRKLQAVYRIALCMSICLFVLTSLFNNIVNNNQNPFSPMAWYIAAIVVYFAYELITTKQAKNLIKALPGLGIVVVLNLAIYGVMAGTRSYELNYTPSKDEISSVAVSMEYAYLSDMYSSSVVSYNNRYNSYFNRKTIDIDLYDEEIISIIRTFKYTSIFQRLSCYFTIDSYSNVI